MLYANIKKLEKYLRKYKFKPGFDSIILLKVSFHGFFSYCGRKKGEKKQSKEDEDNIINGSIMATVYGHGEGIGTRIITYRNQKGGIVKGIRGCLW